MTGARDYRRPAEACVEVGIDGITLTLELARTDLLVDAEIARFAQELPASADRLTRAGQGAATKRSFVVSSESLARGLASGLTSAQLSQWFERRTGAETPPAVRLLLAARSPQAARLEIRATTLLRTPTAEVLDGLLQHPETSPYLLERLGPTAAVISAGTLDSLRRTVERLGLKLAGDLSAG
jgi:hypothetical protein